MPITASWWAALKSSPALKSSGCNLGSEELQTLCQPDSRVGSQSTACFRFGLLDVNCCSNSVKLALRYSFTTRGLGQVKLCLLITHTHTHTHMHTHIHTHTLSFVKKEWEQGCCFEARSYSEVLFPFLISFWKKVSRSSYFKSLLLVINLIWAAPEGPFFICSFASCSFFVGVNYLL